MAQVGWVYLDNNGGRHKVGLYHGDNTGHVVLYCNLKVVQVDFSVKESRMYSFFVEDELCEVYLVLEKNNQFTYEFKVNKSVDTPLNQARKATDQRYKSYYVYIGVAFLLAFVCLFGLLGYCNRKQLKAQIAAHGIGNQLTTDNEPLLRQQGKNATATVFLLPEKEGRKSYFTFLNSSSTQVTVGIQLPDTGIVWLPTGFPLADRDQFKVLFLPEDPQVCLLYFDQPLETTIQRYTQLAEETEQRLHRERNAEQTACMVRVITEANGWWFLAHLIGQERSEVSSSKFNRNTYLRMIRSPNMERSLREKCSGL